MFENCDLLCMGAVGSLVFDSSSIHIDDIDIHIGMEVQRNIQFQVGLRLGF